MKKLLMSLALLGTFAAMTAKGDGDSYMYWMVENATYSNGDTFSFYAAELVAVDKDGNSTVVGASFGDGGNAAKNVSANVTPFQGDDWKFFVELYASAGDDNPFTRSTSGITYSQAFANGAIYDHTTATGAGVQTFNTFNVPEPTSGLLMLFGLCGLALKRKRA